MNNTDAAQAQIDDLQTRVAFQEDALQVLSEQIAAHAEQLRLAREHIQLLNQKLNELSAQAENETDVAEARPPHY